MTVTGATIRAARVRFFVMLLAAATPVTGCIPVVRTSIAHYGVEGRLVDSETGEPLSKRRVEVTVDSHKYLKATNRRGEFRIHPSRHRYWAWLIGGPYWMDAVG